MPEFKRCLPLVLLMVLSPVGTVQAQSLKGSREVMERQNQAAIDYGYSFLQTSQEVQSFHQKGYLVQVTGSDTLEIHNVSWPFARSEVKLFLERLSTQYKNACGEKLYVTSLTRPLEKQPGNASDVSVHPTGMAVDLRVPGKGRCRSWLESTLLSLEKADVLDVTRERYPPHFHVALFTKTYMDYLATLQNKRSDSNVTTPYDYTVRRGDSLYLIARRNDTTIDALRATNNLRSDLLQIGQVLQIPGNADNNAGQSGSGAPANQVAAVTEHSHRVKRGDTLWDIARLYGVSINRIRDVNGLSGNLLQIGQELKINGN